MHSFRTIVGTVWRLLGLVELRPCPQDCARLRHGQNQSRECRPIASGDQGSQRWFFARLSQRSAASLPGGHLEVLRPLGAASTQWFARASTQAAPGTTARSTLRASGQTSAQGTCCQCNRKSGLRYSSDAASLLGPLTRQPAPQYGFRRTSERYDASTEPKVHPQDLGLLQERLLDGTAASPEPRLLPFLLGAWRSTRRDHTTPIPTKGSGSPKKWRHVTPAMAIGVTDRKWTLEELLTFQVPPADNLTVKGH